jgi:hypothetical protein
MSIFSDMVENFLEVFMDDFLSLDPPLMNVSIIFHSFFNDARRQT